MADETGGPEGRCLKVIKTDEKMKNSIKVQRAMHDMTQQALAERVGVSRQTVNAVELGYCRIEGKTGNYLFRIEKPPQTVLNSPNPLSRVCEPEDAGFLALYLASSEAATLTGAGVRLDGGSMMV